MNNNNIVYRVDRHGNTNFYIKNNKPFFTRAITHWDTFLPSSLDEVSKNTLLKSYTNDHNETISEKYIKIPSDKVKSDGGLYNYNFKKFNGDLIFKTKEDKIKREYPFVISYSQSIILHTKGSDTVLMVRSGSMLFFSFSTFRLFYNKNIKKFKYKVKISSKETIII